MRKLIWRFYWLWWFMSGDNFGLYVYGEWEKDSEPFKRWEQKS